MPRKCIEKGCNKYPTFNIEGETKALYCLEHKLEGMVNVRNNKCVG